MILEGRETGMRSIYTAKNDFVLSVWSNVENKQHRQTAVLFSRNVGETTKKIRVTSDVLIVYKYLWKRGDSTPTYVAEMLFVYKRIIVYTNFFNPMSCAAKQSVHCRMSHARIGTRISIKIHDMHCRTMM